MPKGYYKETGLPYKHMKNGFQKGHKPFEGSEKTRFNSLTAKKFGFQKGHGLINGGNKGQHWKMSPEKCLNMFRGENAENLFWKGDNAGKQAMHDWVKKWKGKANHCEICGSTNKKVFHWANINHLYHRILEEYISLCPSCHKKYDRDRGVKIN